MKKSIGYHIKIVAGFYDDSMKLNKLTEQLKATLSQANLEKTYESGKTYKEEITKLQREINKTLEIIKNYGKN